MKRRDARPNEFEWHTTTGAFYNSRPMVPIGKPRPIRRANWLGRLVDWVAKLLDAKQP